MAPLPLAPEVMTRWGIAYDAGHGTLRLSPQVVSGQPRTECPAFRAGRSVIGLTLRQQRHAVALRIAVRFGPPVRVEVGLSGGPVEGAVLVDGVALAGSTVAFEARGEHEVVWLGRLGPDRPTATGSDGPTAAPLPDRPAADP